MRWVVVGKSLLPGGSESNPRSKRLGGSDSVIATAIVPVGSAILAAMIAFGFVVICVFLDLVCSLFSRAACKFPENADSTGSQVNES